MVKPEDVWDWLVKGFGRITGMLLNMSRDPIAPPIPLKSLDELESHVRTLQQVIADQRSKAR